MAGGVWKARLTADEDVDEIAGVIAADNLDAALRFLTAVREAYDLLATYPRAGPARRARSSRQMLSAILGDKPRGIL